MNLEPYYIPEPNSGCWLWLGPILHAGTRRQKPYGRLGRELAHRLSFIFFKGPIPDGLEVDHICNNGLCINPDHLQAITHAENIRRALSATCIRGHTLSGDNLIPMTGKRAGERRCRTCYQLRRSRLQDKYNATKREKHRRMREMGLNSRGKPRIG